MIEVAVCDDDRKICTIIMDILDGYARKNYVQIRCHEFHSGESLLARLNGGDKFDLIYLDIEMKAINGIEVGRHIRTILKDYATEIVYISGLNGYDRQLFDVHPLHFISKPIDESIVISDLLIALERAQKYNGKFQYKKGQDVYNVPTGDIIFFESKGREVIIVTTKGSDTFYGTLENVMKEVSEYRFLFIHRSYLINYQHVAVRRYSEVVMSNGAVLPIGRTKRKELRGSLID